MNFNRCTRACLTKIICAICFLIPVSTNAQSNSDSNALLVIGSSYVNGTTRIDDNGIAALNGLAVGLGSFFSLGDALVRNKKLNGLVVNEAAVGSTTIDRVSCLLYLCLEGGKMFGYMSQFDNALKRVAIYNPNNFGEIIGYNAKYLLIDAPNDCIHSDAFGIPQSVTYFCTDEEINASADRIIEVANKALSLGITPIVTIPPKYRDLDLSLVQQNLNLYWVVDEYNYNKIRKTYKVRFHDELPNAVVVDIWRKFVHIGDGIHPNRKTVMRAARKLSKIINQIN